MTAPRRRRERARTAAGPGADRCGDRRRRRSDQPGGEPRPLEPAAARVAAARSPRCWRRWRRARDGGDDRGRAPRARRPARRCAGRRCGASRAPPRASGARSWSRWPGRRAGSRTSWPGAALALGHLDRPAAGPRAGDGEVAAELDQHRRCRSARPACGRRGRRSKALAVAPRSSAEPAGTVSRPAVAVQPDVRASRSASTGATGRAPGRRGRRTTRRCRGRSRCGCRRRPSGGVDRAVGVARRRQGGGDQVDQQARDRHGRPARAFASDSAESARNRLAARRPGRAARCRSAVAARSARGVVDDQAHGAAPGAGHERVARGGHDPLLPPWRRAARLALVAGAAAVRAVDELRRGGAELVAAAMLDGSRCWPSRCVPVPPSVVEVVVAGGRGDRRAGAGGRAAADGDAGDEARR